MGAGVRLGCRVTTGTVALGARVGAAVAVVVTEGEVGLVDARLVSWGRGVTAGVQADNVNTLRKIILKKRSGIEMRTAFR